MNVEELIITRLPVPVRNALQTHSGKLVLAGGFIRATLANEPVNDIDLFISGDKETARMIAHNLSQNIDNGCVVETDNAFTVRGYPVVPQIVYRWKFSHPSELLDSFDFSICQVAIWWAADCSDWIGSRGANFREDFNSKFLRYMRPIGNNVGQSFVRLLKFARLGYTTNPETLAEMMAAMCQGMRAETLLGTESHLATAFLNNLPQQGISSSSR